MDASSALYRPPRVLQAWYFDFLSLHSHQGTRPGRIREKELNKVSSLQSLHSSLQSRERTRQENDYQGNKKITLHRGESKLLRELNWRGRNFNWDIGLNKEAVFQEY